MQNVGAKKFSEFKTGDPKREREKIRTRADKMEKVEILLATEIL